MAKLVCISLIRFGDVEIFPRARCWLHTKMCGFSKRPVTKTWLYWWKIWMSGCLVSLMTLTLIPLTLIPLTLAPILSLSSISLTTISSSSCFYCIRSTAANNILVGFIRTKFKILIESIQELLSKFSHIIKWNLETYNISELKLYLMNYED